MKKKILFIVFTFNLMGLINSCECPSEKYYNYKAIEFEIYNPLVALNDTLKFGLRGEEIMYLAQNKINFQFSNSANATTVCEKGWAGEKYSMTRISIKSDTDFNTNFPSGSELNSIITARGLNSNQEPILTTLNNLNPSTVYLDGFYISQRPEINKTHRFRVEIEKSNGDILIDTSEVIIWQ